MIVSTAPGRCGIVGNPTDMYGGSVISCSTVERARCTIMDSPALTLSVSGFVQMIRSADDMRLQGNYLDIPKAVLTYFELTPANFRCRLSASSEIPESPGACGLHGTGGCGARGGAGEDGHRDGPVCDR